MAAKTSAELPSWGIGHPRLVGPRVPVVVRLSPGQSRTMCVSATGVMRDGQIKPPGESAGSQVLADGAADGLGDGNALVGGADEEIALELGVQAHGLNGGRG
jgi:hypothetical protein